MSIDWSVPPDWGSGSDSDPLADLDASTPPPPVPDWLEPYQSFAESLMPDQSGSSSPASADSGSNTGATVSE